MEISKQDAILRGWRRLRFLRSCTGAMSLETKHFLMGRVIRSLRRIKRSKKEMIKI